LTNRGLKKKSPHAPRPAKRYQKQERGPATGEAEGRENGDSTKEEGKHGGVPKLYLKVIGSRNIVLRGKRGREGGGKIKKRVKGFGDMSLLFLGKSQNLVEESKKDMNP